MVVVPDSGPVLALIKVRKVSFYVIKAGPSRYRVDMEQTKRFSNRKLAIIGLLAVIVIIVIAVIIFMPKNNSEPTVSKIQPGETITSDQIKQENQNKNSVSNPSQPAPSSTDFYNQIAQSNKVAPGISFGVVNTVSPLPGWYVVTIKANGVGNAKVIFQQTSNPNNPLTIIAGPGTNFPPDTISLPDAVRKALK